MNGYETIINSIKRGMIAPVYLFYGTELYLRDKAVAALKEYFTGGDSGQLNLTTVNAGQVSLQEVIDAANTLPFFFGTPLNYRGKCPIF
ncbi:MAG TPA: hypothetical protein VHQ46_00085 [Desulfobacteria bacterium]|nr:hypothetical protein [Desulfobacteria bacterium]